MPGNRTRILTIIYPLLIIGLFMGCRRTYRSEAEIKQEIRDFLSLREQAMESKDIELYMQCISGDYRDKTDTYATIREKMHKNFLAFEDIDFSQFHQTIYQEDDMAMVVQDYELAFTIGGKRDCVRDKEKIFLERKEGKWKIIKGL